MTLRKTIQDSNSGIDLQHSALSRAINRGLRRRIGGMVFASAALTLTGATQAAEIEVFPAGAVDNDVNGNCSLVEAVTAANTDVEVDACAAGYGTDNIVLPAGSSFTFDGVDPAPFDPDGLNALPSITGEIIIAGNGSTIERSDDMGTPRFRLLHIADTGTLALNNATISGGRLSGLESGGGIESAGDLTLSGVTVSENRAGGGNSVGGGIFTGGNVTLIDSTVSANRAERGGGIANGGGLYLTNSTVSGNTADFFAGGIFNVGTAVLVDSTINGNSAEYFGGMSNRDGTASLQGVTISGNTATTSNGGGFHTDRESYVTLRNCTISDNTAAGSGGGVFSQTDRQIGSFEPYLKIFNSTISGNTAGNRGGGIYMTRGYTYLYNSTVTENSAPEGGGAVCPRTPNKPFGRYAEQLYVGSSIIADNTNGDTVQFFLSNPIPCFISKSSNVIGNGNGSHRFNDQDDINGVSDPGLGPLAYNGGPTRTHALCTAAGVPYAGCTAASLALNRVDEYFCPASGTDQRGVPEPFVIAGSGSGQCDSGSFEAGAEFDLGDAPGSYPTLLADNGAVHVIDPAGPILGTSSDAEDDGQPTAGADGDDTMDSDDEDGVILPSAFEPGQSVDGEVQAIAGNADGVLNAWIDFNADGDWADDGEQIAMDLPLIAGTSMNLVFDVPDGAVPGGTFARFRIAGDGGAGSTGLQPDGEVEDYRIEIAGPEATVMPERIDFGEQPVLGMPSDPKLVMVENTDLVDLEIDNINLAGPAAGDFTLQGDLCSGQTIDPGMACGFELVFTPQAPGVRNAQASIISDAPGSPDLVELVGTHDVLLSDGFEEN